MYNHTITASPTRRIVNMLIRNALGLLLVSIAHISVVYAAPPLQWKPLGEPSVGGWMTAIQVNPKNSSNIVVGGDMLGAAYSTDGGLHWTPSTGLAAYEIGDFTWHPDHVNEVWVGTYGGPAKSTDGGHTFVMKNTGFDNLGSTYARAGSSPIEAVLINPRSSCQMIAISGSQRDFDGYNGGDIQSNPNASRVFYSDNCGDSWRVISSTGSGNNRSGVWTSNGSIIITNTQGIMKSTDAGQSWHQVSGGDGYDVTVSGTNPNQLWASGIGWLKASTDGGDTWSDRSTGLPLDDGPLTNVEWGTGDVLLTGNQKDQSQDAAYMSRDGGMTWSKTLNTALNTPYHPGQRNCDVAEIDPSSAQTMYCANQHNFFKTTDGGGHWTDTANDVVGSGWKGRGYSGINGFRMAFNTENPLQFTVMGADSANPLTTVDGGQSWYRPGSDSEFHGGVDASYFGNLMATVKGWSSNGDPGNFNGINISTDGGKTGHTVKGNGLPQTYEYGNPYIYVPVLSIEVFDANRIGVVFMDDGVYLSGDKGQTWTRGGFGNCQGPGEIEKRPGKLSEVYVACSNGIYMSTDSGVSWTDMPGSPTSYGGRNNRMHVTGNGHIYLSGWYQGNRYTMYNGTNWTQMTIPDASDIVEVVEHPANPLILAAVSWGPTSQEITSGRGVYLSRDGGQTWSVENGGLGMTRMGSVGFNPGGNGDLIVGTNGQGFYITNVDSSQQISPTPSPSTGPACPKKPQGDADCDGNIKLADYERWRQEYNGTLTTTSADFNASSSVTLADYEIWRRSYLAP